MRCCSYKVTPVLLVILLTGCASINQVLLTPDTRLTAIEIESLKSKGVEFLYHWPIEFDIDGVPIRYAYRVYVPDSLAPQVVWGSIWSTSEEIKDHVAPIETLEAMNDLKRSIEITSRPGSRIDLLVQTLRIVSRDQVYDAFQTLDRGCVDLSTASPYGPTTWMLNASVDCLDKLFDLDVVLWVEAEPAPMQPFSTKVGKLIGTETVNLNYLGGGVRVGIADGGIYTHHSDLPCSKLYAFDDCPISWGEDYHATLIASIVAGDGASNGLASSLELGDYPMVGAEYDALYEMMNNKQTQVSNHSYSLDKDKAFYSAEDAELDFIIRGTNVPDLPAITPAPQVWAGGGYQSPSGIDHQAKNTIVVSSVATDSCHATNKNDCAVFDSGFGFTQDLRIKPDLVAPGCHALPNAGIAGAASWAPDAYTSGCAVSFAAPAGTAVVALIMDALATNNAKFALPASYKAVLIQTAIDQTENDGVPGPDRKTGWGLIDAKRAVAAVTPQEDGSVFWYEGSIDLNDPPDELCMNPGVGETIKVTLAWDDTPGLPCATDPITGVGLCNANMPKLQQDLDLHVYDQKQGFATATLAWGVTPNPLDPTKWIMAPDTGDHRNNVELVNFQTSTAPLPSDWRIRVSAFHTTEKQPYGLVASHSIAPCVTAKEESIPRSPEIIVEESAEEEPPLIQPIPPSSTDSPIPSAEAERAIAQTRGEHGLALGRALLDGAAIEFESICEVTRGCRVCTEEKERCYATRLTIQHLAADDVLVLRNEASNATNAQEIPSSKFGHVVVVPSRRPSDRFTLRYERRGDSAENRTPTFHQFTRKYLKNESQQSSTQ